MSFTMRLARPKDGERISGLLESFREEFAHTGETVIPLPVSHEGPLLVLLAEKDSQLLGFLAVQRCHSLVRGSQFLLITDIYVSADHRRQGVATALMTESMALGRRLGCDSVSLIVEDINNATLATAARAGFAKHHDLLLTCRL
jgi:ribosomal protein S18 acetylase RimI-like enzyme